MNDTAIARYLVDTFKDIQVTPTDGNTFFFHDPARMFPFVTLVTNDAYDAFSNLTRPGVFRLNIGLGKGTWDSLFGTASSTGGTAPDFTALDTLMSHPVYGGMHWVCILNPEDSTFETIIRPLLTEAYELAVSRLAKRTPQAVSSK